MQYKITHQKERLVQFDHLVVDYRGLFQCFVYIPQVLILQSNAQIYHWLIMHPFRWLH